MKLPTDLKILKYIYKTYYKDYSLYSKEEKNRETKIYVPISIEKIANHFKVDNDIIFGRLYYYLDKKYSYRQYDNSIVAFFSPSIGQDNHCVNFLLLSSVLANLKEEHTRFWTTTIIAFCATILAALAIIISLLIKT